MANITCKEKVFQVLGFLCFLLLIQKNNAFEFRVGGQKGWTVPDNTSSKGYYNDWAERNRFQIGDSLLFAYDSSQDSVVQVTKENYDNCTTKNSLATFNDGHTVFPFKNSGPYFFISGNTDNCNKNEKLVVVVLADRSNTTASPPSPGSSDMVPAPTPSNEESPPPAPTPSNEESPPPAPTPSNEESPPPAPTPSNEESPPPAPTPSNEESPPPAPTEAPPNSASSMFLSFIGFMGAFFASSLILAI